MSMVKKTQAKRPLRHRGPTTSAPVPPRPQPRFLIVTVKALGTLETQGMAVAALNAMVLAPGESSMLLELPE